RFDLARGSIRETDVEALHIAAQTLEPDLVRARTGPQRFGLFMLALARAEPVDLYLHGLIPEGIGLRDEARFCRDVENLQLRLRRIAFARHRVAVSLQSRPRICERIDHPQLRDLARVAPDERELLRIARPGDVARGLTGARVVLLLAFLALLL